MNLTAVMEEVADILRGLSEWTNVYAYPPDTITPPAAIVSYPDRLDYLSTYSDAALTGLTIVAVASRTSTEEARNRVSAWSATDGLKSVSAAFENHRWESCSGLVIATCEFGVATIAGVDYIAAIFQADVPEG